MNATCLPLLCPPTGPGVPFGTPLIAALDVVRVACWVAGLYIIAMSITAIQMIHNGRQRAIYVALIFAAAAIIGTEIDHLGDYAHYRLAMHLGMVLAGCYGLRRVRERVQDWDAGTGAHSARPRRST